MAAPSFSPYRSGVVPDRLLMLTHMRASLARPWRTREHCDADSIAVSALLATSISSPSKSAGRGWAFRYHPPCSPRPCKRGTLQRLLHTLTRLRSHSDREDIPIGDLSISIPEVSHAAILRHYGDHALGIVARKSVSRAMPSSRLICALWN
jgi:hypothetical protein